jgi:hypothetical protein
VLKIIITSDCVRLSSQNINWVVNHSWLCNFQFKALLSSCLVSARCHLRLICWAIDRIEIWLAQFGALTCARAWNHFQPSLSAYMYLCCSFWPRLFAHIQYTAYWISMSVVSPLVYSNSNCRTWQFCGIPLECGAMGRGPF